MDSFLKNLMNVIFTVLIFSVPVLLTLSFCLGWPNAIQEILCIICIFDFIIVLILVISFAEGT